MDKALIRQRMKINARRKHIGGFGGGVRKERGVEIKDRDSQGGMSVCFEKVNDVKSGVEERVFG